MEPSNRQRGLLNCLLAHSGYIASEEIAKQLGVSVRTVHRDIAAINKIAPIIHNTPSKGIRLDYKAYLAAAQVLRGESRPGGLSVQERRRVILLLLLFASPTGYSINRLSEIFYIAQSSIRRDMKHLAGEVRRYELELRPAQTGTAVAGRERAIRNALMEQAAPLLSPGLAVEANAAGNRLELEILQDQGLLLAEEFSVVARAIYSVENQFGFRIENPEYQDLLTYLIIVVERIRCAKSREEAGGMGTARPADAELRTGLAGVPRALIDEIAHSLDLEVPESEAEPLRAFLFRTWGDDTAPSADTPAKSAQAMGERLIQLVSDELRVDLTADQSLREKLLQHLGPMLFRTEHGMQILNPVLAEIKSQFPEVHEATATALVTCENEFNVRHISESESAYLVLYLQCAVESQRNFRKMRVVVVCSTGRSTAYFLQSWLEEKFPQWDIAGVLGTRELEERMVSEECLDGVDLFVSTVPIPSDVFSAVIISRFR